jgi:hypothetical protein
MRAVLTWIVTATLVSFAGIAHAESCIVADPTGTPLNVRKGPNPNAPIFGALKNGTTVSTGTSRGDWVSIVPREASGKSGWVYRKFLDCREPAKGATGTTNTEPPIVPGRADVDGNLILYACTSSDSNNVGFCHTYMTAVADTLNFMGSIMKDQFPICAKGITSHQMGQVVVKYIRDNPKDRHLNAATIAALAFKEAWPCGN